MGITSGIVLYAVIWFLTMFVMLPIGLRTQEDEGKVVPGTQSGAPANFNVKRKMLIVTIIATVVWAVIAGIILSGWIGVRDFDFRGVMD